MKSPAGRQWTAGPTGPVRLTRYQMPGPAVWSVCLDGYDRGAKVIARALWDAGMEVVYTGLRQTAETVVKAVLREGVQVIGLLILSGAHKDIVSRVMELPRARESTATATYVIQ